MSTDNSVKPLLPIGPAPQDGDLLKYSEADQGWIATTLDAELAGATKIGSYTLPEEDGNDGDVLTTDGNGVLSWTTPA